MNIFHRHDWSDWSISERGKVVDGIYHRDIVGSYIVQNRFCRKCGMHKIKQQRTGTIRSDVKLVPDAKQAMRAPQKDIA